MNNKDLNKKEKKNNDNKQIMVLLVVILLVVAAIFLALKFMGNTSKKVDSANIETIMKNGETKIVFVMSSDKSNEKYKLCNVWCFKVL